MIYRLRRLKPFQTFCLLMIINIALLSFQFRTPTGQRFIKNWFFTVATPVWAFMNDTLDTVEIFLTSVSTVHQLKQENHRLTKELEQLKFDQKVMGDQMARVALLEKFLHVLMIYDRQGWVGEIVTRGFNIWDQGIVVRGGTLENLSPELPVLSSEGIIGQTLQCGLYYSDIALVTNSGFAMAGAIPGKDIRGMIHGRGESLLRFDYVTISAPVSLGDLIVSSGDEGIFPAGHPIGIVVDIRKTGEVFQEILVKPSAEIKNRRFVLILRKSGRNDE